MKSYRKELWFDIPRRRAYLNITDDQRLAAALHNRETVKRLNDPGLIGESIIEMAFS